MSIIRILASSRQATTWLWTVNGILVAISIPCAAVHFAQCRPVSAAWAPIGQFSCWDARIVNNIGIAQGCELKFIHVWEIAKSGLATASFTDFALAAFPIPALWRLQMPLKTKVQVGALLGFGAFAGVAALVRTCMLATLGSSADFTWDSVNLVIWITLEANITVVSQSNISFSTLW